MGSAAPQGRGGLGRAASYRAQARAACRSARSRNQVLASASQTATWTAVSYSVHSAVVSDRVGGDSVEPS